MKKYILTLAIIFLTVTNSAFAGIKSDINEVISKSNISRSSISISVKNANTGKTVYELNPKTPNNPASNQKIITATAALMTLGDEYRFSTKLYKTPKNEYVIELGADPYLSTRDLSKIVSFIPKEQNGVCIDSNVIDSNEWGEGWQWDDDLNPYMPRFSAYNLDGNIMEITIIPSMKGYPAQITQNVVYPITYINKTKTSDSTKYTLKRQYQISPDIIVVEGNIKYNQSEIKEIPINNPKKYFTMRLSDVIIDRGISCSGEYKEVKITPKDKLITILSHGISQAKKDIYKNSNNMITETVFKLAGGKYKNETGSFENGREMFIDFCNQRNIDISNIKITDASGVSKNNLMTADFIADFLYNVQGFLESELPTAGEGTLAKRMLYLRGFVHAKTGTLSNVSAISGYISTKHNQRYVFSIIINNPNSSDSDKKMLEEYILRTIYIKG